MPTIIAYIIRGGPETSYPTAIDGGPMNSKEMDLANIRNYYGDVLAGTNDLRTGACCEAVAPPPWLRQILGKLHPEILERYYGCGSPIPPALEGCTVLDLGCGTGRDVYVCSSLVGEQGRVIGLDMTDEQLGVGRHHAEEQARRFGHEASNVSFREGFIEDLAGADVEDESVDVVISNCVINLSPDKGRVLSEVFRVLKTGGELLFSDVFADRRLPAELRDDSVLLGECLAGAMYVEDFRRMLLDLGVADFRVLSNRPFSVDDPVLAERLGPARFYSITVRAFKLPSMEDRCEDYGQVAWYRGTIPNAPHSFVLDDHHELFTGKPMLVCGNTAAMLAETRLGPHFRLEGDRSVHHGLFPCGPEEASEGSCDDGGACC